MNATVVPELLTQLQEWYSKQCNGDWEHTYGISISTLDNPGWSLRIDLIDTYLFGRTFDEVHVEGDSHNSWYVCKISNNVFEGSCGPNRLYDVVALFLEWANRK